MEQIFNNREIAVSVWGFIFLSWAIIKKDVRESMKQVLLAFCHRAILTIFALMAGYVYLVAHILFSAGLWELGQLKNTMIWFVFVASVELFKANTVHEEKGYFKKNIKGHFKLLVILEFIIAFKSFSLIAELVVVPLSTLAVMMLAFSESKEEYQSVEKMMSWLLSIFVICMVAFGIYSMASNFGEFAQSKTLMDFSTPIILSILLLPFIFIVSVYMVYERIFSRVNAYTENRFHRNYAKFKGLLFFKRDRKSLNNWVSFMCVSDFESRKTIDESIVSAP